MAIHALGALPGAHVAYYLMKSSAGACQLTYLSRTTPPELCAEALGSFDLAQRAAFGRVTGLPIETGQWVQASAPTRHSGLGLRQASSVMDAAYVASSRAAETRAADIWPDFIFTSNPAQERARQRLDEQLGGVEEESDVARDAFTQKQWTQLLENKRAEQAKERAGGDERVRLHAYGAATACKWLNTVPSKAIDTELTNAAFRDNVAIQLGVDVCEEIVPCTAVPPPLPRP